MQKSKSKTKQFKKLKLKETETRNQSISTSPLRTLPKKQAFHESILGTGASSPLRISTKRDTKKKAVQKFSKTKSKPVLKKISLDEDLNFDILKTDEFHSTHEKRQRSKERCLIKRVGTETAKYSDFLLKKNNSIDESKIKEDSKLDLKERLKINIDEVKKLKKSQKKIPNSDEKSLMSKRSQDFKLYLKGKINFSEKTKRKISEVKGKDRIFEFDLLDKKKKTQKSKKNFKQKSGKFSIDRNLAKNEGKKQEISREIEEMGKADSPILSNKSSESFITAGLKSEREEWVNPWEFRNSLLNSEFVEDFKAKFRAKEQLVPCEIQEKAFDCKFESAERSSSDSQISEYLVENLESPKKSISNLAKPRIPLLSLSLLKQEETEGSYSDDYGDTVNDKKQHGSIIENSIVNSKEYSKSDKNTVWETQPDPGATLKNCFKTLDLRNVKKSLVQGEESFVNTIEPEFTSFDSLRKPQRSEEISIETYKYKNQSMDLIDSYEMQEKAVENKQEKCKDLKKGSQPGEESIMSEEILTKSTENLKKILEKEDLIKYNIDDLRKIEFLEQLLQKAPITINNFYQSTGTEKYTKEDPEPDLKQNILYKKNVDNIKGLKNSKGAEKAVFLNENPGCSGKKELQLITRLENICVAKNQAEEKQMKNILKIQTESSSFIEVKPLSKTQRKPELKIEQMPKLEEKSQLKNEIESVSNIEIKSFKKASSLNIDTPAVIQVIQEKNKEKALEPSHKDPSDTCEKYLDKKEEKFSLSPKPEKKPKGLSKLLEITKTCQIDKKKPEEKLFPKAHSKHSPFEDAILIKPVKDGKNFFDSPTSSDLIILSSKEQKNTKIPALIPEISGLKSKKTAEKPQNLSLNFDRKPDTLNNNPDCKFQELSSCSSRSENSSKKTYGFERNINESLKPITPQEKSGQKAYFSSKFFENSGDLSSDRSRRFSETTKAIVKVSEDLETRKNNDFLETPLSQDARSEKIKEKNTENSTSLLRPTPLQVSYKSDLFKSFNPNDSSASSDINLSNSDSPGLSPREFQTPISAFFSLSKGDWSPEIDSIISSEIFSFLRTVCFKITEKEVDPSLDFIVEYVNFMANALKENEIEVLEAINTPVYQEPLARLASFQDPCNPILCKFPTLELILPPDLCSELKVNFDSLDTLNRQIYLQMLFDCVNESLNYVRPFGVTGIPDPWSTHPRILFGEAEIENVFNQVLIYIVKWANCRGGILHEDTPDTNLRDLREEKMSSLLCLDINEEESDWLAYEEEETQMKVLAGNRIFNTLIEEICEILTK